MHHPILLTTVACVVALLAPSAKGATFNSQQVVLDGVTNIEVTAINNAGTMIGGWEQGGSFGGFVVQGATLSFLSGYPTSINDAGAVVVAGCCDAYIWKDGSVISNVDFPNGFYSNDLLFLNKSGTLGFSLNSPAPQTLAYEGKPGHVHAVRNTSQSLAIVNSINDAGVIAGVERAVVSGQPTQLIFFGHDGLINTLGGTTGNTPLEGGYVNNAGQIAYDDTHSMYVYSNGIVTSMAPQAASYGLRVTAINNHGRVVGSYTDQSQTPYVKRAFLFNGTQFIPFGSYNSFDQVTVSLNDHGVMAVTDIRPTGVVLDATTYLVHCHGNGC